MTAASLPKPRVTAAPPDTWHIDFGKFAADGVLSREPDQWRESDRWAWSVDLPSGETRTGHSGSDRLALSAMWCLAARRFAPASLVIDDIAAVRLSRNIRLLPASKVATVLRGLLTERTGLLWSVCVGRGDSASNIRILSRPKRQVDGRMTAHDTALLAAVLGEDHVSCSGVTLADLNARVSFLRAVIGPQSLEAVAL